MVPKFMSPTLHQDRGQNFIEFWYPNFGVQLPSSGSLLQKYFIAACSRANPPKGIKIQEQETSNKNRI
jgi:hypothetical protein